MKHLSSLIDKSVELSEVPPEALKLIPVLFNEKSVLREPVLSMLFWQISFLALESEAGVKLLSEFIDSFLDRIPKAGKIEQQLCLAVILKLLMKDSTLIAHAALKTDFLIETLEGSPQCKLLCEFIFAVIAVDP